jgi:pre-mRNA-splicing factor 18
MDFAALMSKEISKAKAPPKSSVPDKKYLKRSEIEAQRRAEYEEYQRTLEEERRSKESQKRKREEEELEEKARREEKRQRLAEELHRKSEAAAKEEERVRRKRLGLPELVEKVEEEEVLEDDIPDSELVELLRGKGEPAKLFGETHKARLARWMKVSVVMTKGPIPTTLELVEEKDMRVPAVPPPKEDKAARRYLYRQLASYFTMVLAEWGAALRREGQNDSFASKSAWSAVTQAKTNMVPLFRHFEKGDLEESILTPVVEIVHAAQSRRYVDANDGYLRLSIGKAAWPIGVTMVGIHERSAREKLHESDKGHVMGDEVTRKFLQSIKRCLSFAQVRWPPEDVRQLMG